jgi:predicted glycosyltransferase
MLGIFGESERRADIASAREHRLEGGAMHGQRPGDNAKILLYSQGTSGLERLRHSMAIADSLVARHRELSVLVLTGSPIFGALDSRARVDFVRIPGVATLENGGHRSLGLHMNVETTIALRRGIIERIADIFDPDIFIADNEPLGLRGELWPALQRLKARDTHLVLGLRDVPDEPHALGRKWRRNGSLSAIDDLYDGIWIYGLEAVHQPLIDLNPPQSVLNKVAYTGYLDRTFPSQPSTDDPPGRPSDDYILVTAGSGGNGADLIDWVLSTYEARPDLPLPARLVLGPFIAQEMRAAFRDRAEDLRNVELHEFDGSLERLIGGARAVVSLGGYNTFCQILSYDKPALIVPPAAGHRDRSLRARRAQAKGLARLLDLRRDPKTGAFDLEVMAEALKALPEQGPPSTAAIPGLLDGLERVNALVTPWLTVRQASQAKTRRA